MGAMPDTSQWEILAGQAACLTGTCPRPLLHQNAAGRLAAAPWLLLAGTDCAVACIGTHNCCNLGEGRPGAMHLGDSTH